MFVPLLAVAALFAAAFASPAPLSGDLTVPGTTPARDASAVVGDRTPADRQAVDWSKIVAAAARQPPCTDTNQCSFLDTFSWKNNKRWFVAHDYTNGQVFDSWWSKDRVFFDTQKKKVRLSIKKEARHNKPYVSGHFQTNKWHGYGCYEVRMKPPNQEGLITTFFSYTGKFDHAPGQAKNHNEVDVEFVYKKHLKKVALQANYFTNGNGGNERIIPLKFNPTKKLHNYAFKWTSKGIEWYVDGNMVYSATKKTPKIFKGPHKIMMNLWPVSKKGAAWGGKYVWKGKRTAVYSGVRFTRGEDCTIQNRFDKF